MLLHCFVRIETISTATPPPPPHTHNIPQTTHKTALLLCAFLAQKYRSHHFFSAFLEDCFPHYWLRRVKRCVKRWPAGSDLKRCACVFLEERTVSRQHHSAPPAHTCTTFPLVCCCHLSRVSPSSSSSPSPSPSPGPRASSGARGGEEERKQTFGPPFVQRETVAGLRTLPSRTTQSPTYLALCCRDRTKTHTHTQNKSSGARIDGRSTLVYRSSPLL